MKNLNYIAGGILGTVLIVLLLCFLYLFQRQTIQTQKSNGLFSWNGEVLQEEEWTQLQEILEEFQIKDIYQEATKENMENGSMSAFIKRLHKINVDVYYLVGKREWGLEADGSSLKKEIEYAFTYNENVDKDQMLKGIMVDIEPYLTTEWREATDDEKKDYFKIFVDGMEEAYRYAKEKKVELILCIPNFYETYSSQDLERLTANGCDGLAVMNYNRKDEAGQITTEVEYAKRYQKKIISIAELQKPGVHGLEEINTYYNEGLTALAESWEHLKEWFQYDQLSFAYHYYDALKEMIEKET